jgi:hypothetical protein
MWQLLYKKNRRISSPLGNIGNAIAFMMQISFLFPPWSFNTHPTVFLLLPAQHLLETIHRSALRKEEVIRIRFQARWRRSTSGEPHICVDRRENYNSLTHVNQPDRAGKRGTKLWRWGTPDQLHIVYLRHSIATDRK